MNASANRTWPPRWGRQEPRPDRRPGAWFADATVALGLFLLFYLVVALAESARAGRAHPQISLRLGVLPEYAAFSLLRMAAAYVLSLAFSLVYGYIAANNRRAERFLVPILDILQSVPILSFLPAVVLALTGLFPHSSLGVELASVLLVFTSQAWNMTFSFYHSLLTIPGELREVARMHRLSRWQRFRMLDLPAAVTGLVWNSMMSWAGGWFFLMAAEMFTAGSRSFQLRGLGSYLQQAANVGNGRAEVAGLVALVLVIIGLDQLLWRPLIAWADKFKLEMVGNQSPPRSAVLMLLRRSLLVDWVTRRALAPATEALDRALSRRPAGTAPATGAPGPRVLGWLLCALVVAGAADASWHALRLLLSMPGHDAARIPAAALLSTLRVAAALALGSAWCIPVGVFIGLNRAWAERLQPVVQILASFPATAIYPLMAGVLGNLGWTSILLMLLGTQWYVLFNVIAGAMGIPQDLREATALFGLGPLQRWRTLILPGIFPSLVTGLITAAGGAWNATIVTEYVVTSSGTKTTLGLGALIAEASAHADYGLLLGATLALALVVVGFNRLVWGRMYRLAETRYTLMS
jgi:NitT/TauT family transport system permease protein